jgi:RimJ/RimL family protein N-acetyltransferase
MFRDLAILGTRCMMTVFEIPNLRTDHLVLRAFRASDIDAWAAMEAEPEVRRYRGNNPRTRIESWAAMERSLGQWALRGYGLFALELAADGRFAGFAGMLHPEDWPEPELAYSLAPHACGQGLATEAAAAARDWAFEQHGMRRLASFIASGNVRSIRVAERLGAVREGELDLHGHPAQWWAHYAAGHGPIV